MVARNQNYIFICPSFAMKDCFLGLLLPDSFHAQTSHYWTIWRSDYSTIYLL